MGKQFTRVFRTIPLSAMNAVMDTRWSTIAHDDAVRIVNGVVLCRRAKKSIAAHPESCTMAGWRISTLVLD